MAFFENIVKRKGKLMFTITVVANVFLLITLLTPFVNPSTFWFIELFGLAYPIIFSINLLFFLYWAILRRKRGLITLGLLLLSYPDIRNYIQFEFGQDNTPKENDIKVMSYNVRLFDIYNWTKNKSTRSQIFKMLREEYPGILCIQEFYTSEQKKMYNLDSLLEIQKSEKYHVEYTSSLTAHGNWGLITCTSYPIINKGRVSFYEKTNNLCIYTDIKIKEDTIRVFNVHFQSNRLKKEDYEFIDAPYKKKDEDILLASKKIVRRLKIGVIKRAKQVDLVTEFIKNSPYPVILCGDFNDTPCSYTYHSLSDHLEDTFVERGNGIGNTYNGSLPPLRIDYILHSNHFKCSSYKVIKKKLSDHYPVTTTLSLKDH